MPVGEDLVVRIAEDADTVVRVVGDQVLNIAGASDGELVVVEGGALATRVLTTGDMPAAMATDAEVAAAYIAKTTADAQSVLGATADDTPIAFPIAASRLFGRKATGDVGAMTGAEAAVILADSMLPWHVDVNLLAPPDTHTNWGGNPVVNAGAFMAGYRQSSGAQNDEMTYEVILAAGTYDFTLMHYKSSNRAIYTISLEGQALGTIDGYAAVSAVGFDTLTGLVIPTGGKLTLRFLLATRNASNVTGYFGTVSWAHFRRTA